MRTRTESRESEGIEAEFACEAGDSEDVFDALADVAKYEVSVEYHRAFAEDL